MEKKKNFDIFGQVSQVHGITLHNHPHKNEKQKHANMWKGYMKRGPQKYS